MTGFLSLLLFISAPVQTGDLKFRDILFQIRGPIDLDHSDILIVEMSQQADREIPYKYPWPTYVYAKLIENLNKAGARAIVFDVMFDQNDMYDQANDSLFAEAAAEAGNVLFIGGFRRTDTRGSDAFVVESISPVFPLEGLMEASPLQVGFVEMQRDSDGFIRSYPLQFNHQGESYYSLALQTLPLVKGESVTFVNRGDQFLAGGAQIPKNAENRMLINYYGGYRSFDYISLERIVDDADFETTTEQRAFEVNEFDHPEYGLLHQGILEDRVVLIGATMPELQDFHQVPFPDAFNDRSMAGVEVHAHALQTILDQNFLRETGFTLNLILVSVAFLTTFLVTIWLVGWGALFATLLLIASWSILIVLLFLTQNLYLPILPVLLAIGLAYTGSTLQSVLYEMREKRKIKSMFSSYVSPELVERMVEDDIPYKLGGSEEELTVLFSDIENFTPFSEGMKPDELVGMMNRYLDHMSAIINDHQGTLDKYIGDAVMAFYGAPVPSEEHAANACRTVIACGSEWDEADTDRLPVRTRFGVNTGTMLVGNVGSERRFNYTVMGDQVNVGARCESACKALGVYAIVSEETESRVRDLDEFLFRYLGYVKLKGRQKPLGLYQLLGYKAGASAEVVELAERFGKGVEHYQSGEFEAAEEIFRDLLQYESTHLEAAKSVNPSSIYIAECLKLKSESLDPEWDGTIRVV
ncbi:MAG: adenylate/guanylate cyclase domain-containing protein [Balneolaceae bacterium]|nr:adenylate/guanylate cyclase domain-containing protein [Balneolaceae bacterium]MCH8548094.1 adenylate/guanylate cyclase domain-containing protein [Balneolaceae bacterium]